MNRTPMRPALGFDLAAEGRRRTGPFDSTPHNKLTTTPVPRRLASTGCCMPFLRGAPRRYGSAQESGGGLAREGNSMAIKSMTRYNVGRSHNAAPRRPSCRPHEGDGVQRYRVPVPYHLMPWLHRDSVDLPGATSGEPSCNPARRFAHERTGTCQDCGRGPRERCSSELLSSS